MSRRITTRMRHAGKPRHGTFIYLQQADGSYGDPIRIATAIADRLDWYRRNAFTHFHEPIFCEPVETRVITGTFTITNPAMFHRLFFGWQYDSRKIWRQIRNRQPRRTS